MIQPDLSQVRACAKPCCRSSHIIDRHHKGCEKIWVRNFITKKGEARYEELVARYNSFDSRDVIHICRKHHWEIHARLVPLIRRHKAKLNNKPFRSWTWREAESLIAACTQSTNNWLKLKTPGRKKKPKLKY